MVSTQCDKIYNLILDVSEVEWRRCPNRSCDKSLANGCYLRSHSCINCPCTCRECRIASLIVENDIASTLPSVPDGKTYNIYTRYTFTIQIKYIL